MEKFMPLLMTGIAQGSIIAITALGFLLIYKATGVVNFAQGDFSTLGAYVAVWATTKHGWSLPTAWILAIVVLFVIGALIERIAYAPLRGRSVHVVVISTLGAALIIQAGIIRWMGPLPYSLRSPFPAREQTVTWFGARIPKQNLLIIGATIVCVVLLILLFQKTQFGRQVRALASDRHVAQLQGVRTTWMSMLTFGMSAALSAFAGVLIAPTRSVTVELGFGVMLYAFAAAILGGMGNLVGVVIASLAIGLVRQFGAGYISGTYAEIFPFLLMLVVIAAKPQGLFGGESRARL